MKISRENYEIFFIDYFDGNLSDAQIADFEDFLLLNPDLREELEGLEKIKLEPENDSLADKDILRKIDLDTPISDHNFDDYCIAYLEGDLSRAQSMLFESYLKLHPGKRKDLSIYQHTILSANLSESFIDKSSLKKITPVIRRIYLFSGFSIAAAIAILMVIFLRIDTVDVPDIYVEKIQHENIAPVNEDINNREDESITGTENILAEVVEKKSILSKTRSSESFKVDSVKAISEEDQTESSSDSFDNDIYANLDLPDAYIGTAIPDKITSLSKNDYKPEMTTDIGEPEYLSLPDIALNYVNEKVIKKAVPDTEPSKITLWDVADAGIKGINRVTGSEIKLEKQTDIKGETKSISFDAGFIGFYRPVK
jgi:hypothetical protein